MSSTFSDVLSSEIGRYILSNLASVEDDLSDVSLYFQIKSPTTVTEYTLLDVSDGPKTAIKTWGIGSDFRDTDNTRYGLFDLTIDGNATKSLNPDDNFVCEDAADDTNVFNMLPPIRYDDSLKIEWEHDGDGHNVHLASKILGSGPHSIAVVKDGEPVYAVAINLSEATIESMSVPSGYKIVKNPKIDHPNPQTRGMWDDSKEEVVDHPYWKPFHDTLDKLSAMARRRGVQTVLNEIEKNPTPYNGVFGGGLPKENPVEEAIQFWKEREEERTSELSLSDIRKSR